MADIREILISDYLADLGPLFAEQQAEVGEDRAIGLPLVPDPDVERYTMLDDTGMTLALGVFDGDEIVGYSNNVLSGSLHYRGLIVCQNDAIYLRSDYRRGTLGLRLMRETERLARERGADMIVWHAKPDTNFERVLSRRKYAIQETVYTRAL
jgi:GNAT superfamily N-acetyltransferase